MAGNLQWKVTITDVSFQGLTLEDTPIPIPGEYEVLVKMHAVSLNFRDLMIARVSLLYASPQEWTHYEDQNRKTKQRLRYHRRIQGDYPFPLSLPVVPCSDGAGEVVGIGSKVTRWFKGAE